MKYSSSIRLINMIVFLLLFGGFGFLGVWFGFVINPHMLMQSQVSADIKLPEISVGLCSMLGILGVAAALVALVGLVYSVRSFLKGTDDTLVQKSFCCYIGIGYIIAAFCFFNAIWLYRLTSTNIGDTDIAFIIVVYAVLFLIALFASNVPLLKMYGEGEHTNSIMSMLSSTLGFGNLACAIVFGVLYFTNLQNRNLFAHSSDVLLKVGLMTLFAAVTALVCFLADWGYNRCEKRNQIKKSNGFLFEGGLALTGLSIVGTSLIGHLEYYNKMYNISFMAKVYGAKFSSVIEFSVMGYITGGLIFLLALLLCYYTVFPPKVRVEE